MWGNELNTFGQVALILAPFTPTPLSVLIDITNLGKKNQRK
jgi:hypothetical protein